MGMRVSMSSYHHNPYRQSSASYTPQQASHRQQGQPCSATRASTQPPPPPLAPDPDDFTDQQSSCSLSKTAESVRGHSKLPIMRTGPVTEGARPYVSTCVPTSALPNPSNSVANIDTGGTTTLSTSATAATLSAPDSEGCRVHLASSSSLLDSMNSRHPSLTSPLHGPPLPRSRHSVDDLALPGHTAGSLPSFSTPTRYSAASLLSRQAPLSVKLPGSAAAVERQSFSDWFATAVWDDPSTGSCPSSSSWSPLNQTQLRGPVHASETSPVPPADTVSTTLFIDGLPPSIENKWQLQPYVPPQGLVALRVKSSRGRNVGFAVYDSIAAAHEALSWFKQMLMIKEVVQASTFGAPPADATARWTESLPVPVSGGHLAPSGGGAGGCFPGSPVMSESLPLAYEDFLFTQQCPDRFASLLRKCTLLRVEWTRGLETQHAPANVAAGVAAASSVASSPFSHPSSSWGAAASHGGQETGRDGCDGYSQMSRSAPQAPPPQASHHPPLPFSASSPGLPSPQQSPHPFAAIGWTDAQPPNPPAHHSLSSALRHSPLPLTRRTGAFSAPSAPLQRPEPRHHGGGGTAATVYPQDDHFTTCRPSVAAYSSARMAERSDARDRVDPWWDAASQPPASLYRQDEPRLQHRLASHHHHSLREPPLPSRTLFVRLIHNFDAPEYLQQGQVRSNPPLPAVGIPPTISAAMTASGATTPYNEAGALPTSMRCLSQNTPSLRVSPPSAAVPVSGAASTRLPVSIVPHHHHHMFYRSPPSPTLATTPQLRTPPDSRAAQAYSPLQPPLPSQLASPYDGRSVGSASAADGTVLPPTPTDEDREFFRVAQSVLCEEYFSEKFAGFVKYREFLRPPYYGGCFVLFERGEDMQRCLQWMRRDERLMKLFAVAPARNDSFGP
ncbi:hypothetical protein GH5_06668 [Leishmania sp. Ghana 2012 LV757]|uniref:hypothetical protein n=1 Tax=Leishmania sp. Ghana 2012 LV757 TaxID=2803181 RepID=UPI001B76098E|nr:hypothetical protein GH5_06668 [Leishmania sp. Ghana 2012 LV757]